MDSSMQWYSQLTKPFFAPPSWVFGPVWSVLYLIIFVTFGYTIYLVYTKELSKKVLTPMFLNVGANLLFSPIQFGLKSNVLALVDITIVLVTLIWFIYTVYPQDKFIALAQIPYLLWVAFATTLQVSITLLNW